MAIPLILFAGVVGCQPTSPKEVKPHWLDLPLLPPLPGMEVQPGLAGPVAGSHNNYMMVAGGANFEHGMPWEGGQKTYHDEIFILEKKNNGTFQWKLSKQKLPDAIAYSACVSTPSGIISAGGENSNSPVADVFRFNLSDGEVSAESMPSLPGPLSAPGATIIENTVYIAGGTDTAGATRVFLSLDLDNPGNGWKSLPDLPEAMSHFVMAAQDDGNETCIYLFGGRNKTSDVHTFFSRIWKYSPSGMKWTEEGDILFDGEPLALAAGTGFADSNHRIWLFGGDPGIYFNRTERLNNSIAAAKGSAKQDLLNKKDSLLTNHPGFLRTVLIYHTRSKKWGKGTDIPQPAPVTTQSFVFDGNVVIPSGEIKPGVRTPAVLAAQLE